MSIAPTLLYRSLSRLVHTALEDGEDFDLIDAHYAYPDGVAATWLGVAVGKPVILTARGTDLHLIPKYRIPRMLIKGAFSRCAAVVAVSEALGNCARNLAPPDRRIEVLRNGVDLHLFRETERTRTRRELNLTGPTLISVGHLIPRKGHELVIEALSHLPGGQLLVCGEGPLRSKLERKARQCRVADRVNFLGQIDHDELNRFYSAADVLVLASSGEGWPNVVLEAMACGTPVVATAVGAVPDFVDHPHAGRVVHERTVSAIAGAINDLLKKAPSRRHVREYASQFSWSDTTRRLLALFSEVVTQFKVSTKGHQRGQEVAT
jgi:glycosyltransferase involved in cell wall biosynthesis